MFVPVCARLLTIALRVSLRPALTLTSTLALALTFSLITDARPVFAGQDVPVTVEIHGGAVVFDVGTNVSAISVHGKSTALEGRARVRQTDGGLAIEQIDASVPVASLGTGMALRDGHMRKYVFTRADGQTPDVRFEADHADCARVSAGGRDMSCQVAGTLTIRGTARPFAMTLRVSESGGSGTGGGACRAAGDADIKLSAWQIDPPSQLGVQTSDDVKLHLEFATKPSATVTTTAYRGGR